MLDTLACIELPGAPRTQLPVLQPDASRTHLLCGVVANHVRWFEALNVAAGGDVRSIPGGGRLVIGPEEMILAFPRIPAREMPGYLDRVMALWQSRRPRQVSCWARDPKGHGAIGARLAARGFEWGWQARWMTLDLRAMNADFPTPPGLRIAVDDVGEWDVEHLPYYDPAKLTAHATLRMLSAATPRRLWHFGAWLDGKVVGHSVLFLATGRMGVAGIYNVGVVPSARGQGIGRAVTLAACVAARRCGFHYVTLNAATHIYDRIGFETLGRGQTWWLHSERMLNPPSRAEIAFAEVVGMADIRALDAMHTLPDLDVPLACGLTPIQLAARAGEPDAVRWLISRGATLQILEAWDLGWKEKATRMLAERPELANHRSGLWQTTPLHEAALRGDVELARLLLSAGPDLTVCDMEARSTPLGWARHFNRTEIIALIEGGSTQI